MIAILVLTYNNEESTKKCIERIYSNTHSDFILFILDNNSTDGTVNYLLSLKYDNLKVFLNKKNVGIIEGRNQIYKLSETHDYEYLCFLDNDQFVQEGWDESYLDLMKHYDIVGIEAWLMKPNFQPLCRIKNNSGYFNYIGCGGMMIRRGVVENIGLFDKNLKVKYYEDPDFCFRAIQNRYKIGWCADRVIDHQKHDLKLSSEERVFFMRNLRIIQDKWRNFPLPKIKVRGH